MCNCKTHQDPHAVCTCTVECHGFDLDAIGTLGCVAVWALTYTDADSGDKLPTLFVLASNENNAWDAADSLDKPAGWPDVADDWHARLATDAEAAQFTLFRKATDGANNE